MTLPPRNPDEILRARGADSRPAARFEPYHTEREHDGWDIPIEQSLLRTEVAEERARSIITRNRSPDVPFDRSVNPYRGCEHGCVYCYANYDKKTVAENIRFHDPASPFLIGGFREGDIIKEAKQESYFDAQLRLF